MDLAREAMDCEHLKKGGKVKKTSRGNAPAQKQRQKQQQTVNVHVNMGKPRAKPRKPQQKQQQQQQQPLPQIAFHEGFTRIATPMTNIPQDDKFSAPRSFSAEAINKPVALAPLVAQPLPVGRPIPLSSIPKPLPVQAKPAMPSPVPAKPSTPLPTIAELPPEEEPTSVVPPLGALHYPIGKDVLKEEPEEQKELPAHLPFVPEGIDMKEKIHGNPQSFTKMGNIEKIEKLHAGNAEMEKVIHDLFLLKAGKGSRDVGKLNTILAHWNIKVPQKDVRLGIEAIKQSAIQTLKDRIDLNKANIHIMKK